MNKNLSFNEKLELKWNEGKFVCVGLDPDYEKIADIYKERGEDCPPTIKETFFEFNKSIIEATADLVCAFKINSAFYEIETQTWEAMIDTAYYIQRKYPDIPLILDAKRADIGNTNNGYVQMAFENIGAHAITVHPYLGKEALQPFLDRRDKGIIVLVRTSNPGAGEFQDLEIEGKPLYQTVAENVASKWNSNGNCAVVVGATYPGELKKVREIVGDMPILVPGIGAQGGDLEGTIKNGLDSNGHGLIISSSRAIIFSDDPRQATIALNEQIRKLLP